MKKILFLCAPLCAMLMTACVKDEPNARFLKLYAEGYSPDNPAKAAVSDQYTYWVDGDNVWINGSQCDVHVSGSNEAVIRQITENPSHEYRGVYPASALKSVAGNTFTVKVPKTHYYREDSDGKQIIDELPMVAYFSGEEDPEVLEFKHVTAAITVRVKNTRTDPTDVLELDRIELINTQYRLGGEVGVDIRNAASGGSLTVSPQSIGARDSIVVIFNRDVKSVAPNEIADIQIPIIPVGDADSKFTIRVSGHIKGARYIFEKNTNARNNSILRACLGYATTKFEQTSSARDLFDVKTEQTVTVGEEPVTRNFYEINTPDELITLAEALDEGWNTVSDKKKTYRTGDYIVMEDLDLNGATIVPMHYYNEKGKNRVYFYGNGKKITNFVISSDSEIESNCCGLFGKTFGDNISICDLTLENGTYVLNHKDTVIVSGDDYPSSAVGGIISCVVNGGIVIENCTVRNVVFGSSNALDPGGKEQVDFYVGGIVGLATRGCVIKNCTVENVTIDNSNDNSAELVDQFGGCFGRLHGSNKTFYITDFEFNQETKPLEFEGGLRIVRYGGLVANIIGTITLECKNITLNHYAVFKGKPEVSLLAAGLLGSNKAGKNTTIKVDSTGTFKIGGTIENKALDRYYDYDGVGANGNTQKFNYEINKYWSLTSNSAPTVPDGCLEECRSGDFSLTVTSSNGMQSVFRYNGQTLKKKK